MKKIIAIALTLCVMLSVCMVSVGAADGASADFVMGDTVVKAGATTATVVLSLTDNAGFGIGAIYFDYDTDAMEMTNMALVSGTGFTLTKVYGADKNGGVDCDAFAVFDGADDWFGTGDFLTLTFTLNEGISGTFPVTAFIDDDANPLLSYYTDDAMAVYTMDGAGSITVEAPEPVYPFTTTNIALGEKFAINVNYNATANDVITVTSEGEAVEFTAANGVVTIANIDAKNVDKVYTVTINGFEEEFSVAAYCEKQADSSDAKLAAVASAVLDYNKAANNYFEEAAEAIEVPHCDVGTDNPREVSNATEGPTFYSVRLQLNDGVSVVVRMKDYNGEAITVTIGGVAATYTVADVNGMDGIVIPVKANQYDAEIAISVGGSTLTYSVNTYIQQKQTSGDADLVNLVNALGWYGKAVAEYAA